MTERPLAAGRAPAERRIETAELLAVGAELLVGETRDTNSGDLATELTALGVEVRRLSALPDQLEDVARALSDALTQVDLIVTTGGLGPTPDDLTRESIAAVCGESVAVDPTSRPGCGTCSSDADSATRKPIASRRGSSPARARCPIPTAPHPAGGWTVPTAGHRRAARPAS